MNISLLNKVNSYYGLSPGGGRGWHKRLYQSSKQIQYLSKHFTAGPQRQSSFVEESIKHFLINPSNGCWWWCCTFWVINKVEDQSGHQNQRSKDPDRHDEYVRFMRQNFCTVHLYLSTNYNAVVLRGLLWCQNSNNQNQLSSDVQMKLLVVWSSAETCGMISCQLLWIPNGNRFNSKRKQTLQHSLNQSLSAISLMLIFLPLVRHVQFMQLSFFFLWNKVQWCD